MGKVGLVVLYPCQFLSVLTEADFYTITTIRWRVDTSDAKHHLFHRQPQRRSLHSTLDVPGLDEINSLLIRPYLTFNAGCCLYCEVCIHIIMWFSNNEWQSYLKLHKADMIIHSPNAVDFYLYQVYKKTKFDCFYFLPFYILQQMCNVSTF